MKNILMGLGFLGLCTSAALAQTSLTEGQARVVLTNAGCSNISALSMDPKGMWRGMCWKGGAPVAMVVNTQGAVVKEPGMSSLSEAHVRAILANAGYSNVSSMSADSKGVWHVMGWKGPTPYAIAVNAQGVTSMDTHSSGEMSEGNARSIMTDAGCSNISSLNRDSQGRWAGSCWKGGAPMMTQVDATTGKVTMH